MPAMMTRHKKPSGQHLKDPSILLASDSERHGTTMHRALKQNGFVVEFVGNYALVDSLLNERPFDVVHGERRKKAETPRVIASHLRGVLVIDTRQFTATPSTSPRARRTPRFSPRSGAVR